MRSDQELINKYHYKVAKIKGDSVLFVDKQTVTDFFMARSRVYSIKDVREGDNICFFDSYGNIVYQAICVKIKYPVIYVKCLDFESQKDYITKIKEDNYSSIKELRKFEIDTLKVFRDK